MTLSGLSGVNPEIIANCDMDPHVCKRRDYTTGLATATLPLRGAMSGTWAGLAILLRELYTKLGNHPAMFPNLGQTFDTPANSKNSVYFMWDFIGRTLHLLYLVPAGTERLREKQKKAWEDVKGRAIYGSMLILDEPQGMLEVMVRAAPHDQIEPMPAMGPEVEDAARAILGRN